MNHREGLSVFIDRPQVPLDNNLAERVLRGPVIGRRLSFGSDSENGARFTAMMPEDWTERYNTTPVLIETFVETPRYTGAVYRASGWLHVGTTQGRGRYDRDKRYDKPRKDVWLRHLRKDWKRPLNP